MKDLGTLLSRAATRLEATIPDPIRRSYFRKFALGILVLLVTVGAVQGAVTAYTQQEVKQQANDKYETLAMQDATNLELWVEENERAVRLLSDREAFVRGNVSGIQTEMTRIGPDLGPDLRALHYVDLERRTILASTNEDVVTAGEDRDLPPWFGASIPRDRVYVSDVYTAVSTPHGRVEDIQVVAFVIRITEQPSRALVLTASVAEYSTTFQGPGAAGFTVVVDGDREIVFDEFNQFVGERYAATAETERALRRAGGGAWGTVETPPIEGLASSPQVVGYAPVPGTDWTVLIHVPREQAYGYVATISLLGEGALAVVLVLIGAVGVGLGYRTTVSIDRLREKAERIERGDFDVTFETTRVDNIGRLYDSFAHMRDELEARIAEIEAARDDAEERQRHLEVKAEEYREVMQACASGEFARRMNPDSRNQAMSSIAHEFNRMMEEIERTNERLDQFASIVAHDLRNPIGIAEGFLGMARETGDDDHFDEVASALDRMEILIDDLLALARQEEESVDVDDVDLDAVARRAWRNVDTAEMDLETATAGTTVPADEGRLLELLENLYRNAREHAGADVSVRVEPTGEGDGFAVEDTGPGIPAETREEVFDYGYTTSSNGTGLGLNIVEQVADIHEWEVRVTDGAQGGARFELTGIDAG
jgi:methyl-accepting chemotaxis protein